MPKPRWPVVVAGTLTFGAGALDVLALTHLGGVFASVMTGNLALMGLGLARADIATIVHTAVAVLAYGLGVAGGSRLSGTPGPDDPAWPRRVTATLALQLVLQSGLMAGWIATQGVPMGAVQLVLLAAAAASMGLQGAAVRGLGVSLATTYLTGTLTALIARRRVDGPGIAALIAAVGGAACGGVLLTTAPIAAPLLCVGPLAAVVTTAEYRRHRARTSNTMTMSRRGEP
jgi:uncharacterized membrane protein YoaK (UPF0700 family)